MSDMTETDLENQRLREQLNHAALRVLEVEQECQQLKTAQVDRSETIKEAYRELAHIENYLEKSDAPQTVRHRTIDLRGCIAELTS